ncbi:MAG TPA: hypothetical protein VMY37_35115 [Thermoguttaceae bacterium]|nr:hypothetical protein [Thermoguttaceae bacterium]
MRTRLIGCVAVLAACVASSDVSAQAVASPDRFSGFHQTTHLAQIYPVPYGYYGASTPASAYARGVAATTRAAGEYNLLSSQARIARAEARRYELENQLQATETYFKMRLLNRQYRALLRGPRPTLDDLKRYAASGRPERLSPSELDSVTGDISWPILLRDDRYADYRARLEALYVERAASAQLSTSAYLSIHRTTRAFLKELERRVARVPQMDYIAAKRFIQSLAYEVRQPSA